MCVEDRTDDRAAAPLVADEQHEALDAVKGPTMAKPLGPGGGILTPGAAIRPETVDG
jgi:hypothetical protein